MFLGLFAASQINNTSGQVTGFSLQQPGNRAGYFPPLMTAV
ncbi:hypothetical protein D083_3488 [Dickeya solani RNS 08.23.3.1.A]|nr:hypothetical protein D083_3488 [Dickeya solani RNS 08.23.3.1.A]